MLGAVQQLDADRVLMMSVSLSYLSLQEVYTSVPNAGQFHEIEGYQDASSFVNITVSSVSKTVRRQQVLAQSVDRKERS